MQPQWIPKDPCITEEKGKLIKWEGGGVGVCAPEFWRFEDYKCWKNGGWERVPVPWSHETNVLANEMIWHFSNLTAKERWESAKRVLRARHALRRITDFNSSEHLPWKYLSYSISDNCPSKEKKKYNIFCHQNIFCVPVLYVCWCVFFINK